MRRIVDAGTVAALLIALLVPAIGVRAQPAAKSTPVPQPAPAITKEPAPIAAAPLDATALKARAVLEAHCADCHQADRLTGPAPGKAIGNILALDEIARNPALVRPGSPDASPLYLSMLGRRMPPDAGDRAPRKDGPSIADLVAVRNWIEGLPRDAACAARKPIEPADVKAQVQRVFDQRPANRRGQLRFVSLVHFYNSCASEREIRGYGQAIARLPDVVLVVGDGTRGVKRQGRSTEPYQQYGDSPHVGIIL